MEQKMIDDWFNNDDEVLLDKNSVVSVLTDERRELWTSAHGTKDEEDVSEVLITSSEDEESGCSSTDESQSSCEREEESLPDFGVPRISFSQKLQAPVIIYDSFSHPGMVREFTRGKSKLFHQDSAFGWHCLPCMILVESLKKELPLRAREGIPTIVVSDGRIRTDPDNPGKVPHICHPRSQQDAEEEHKDYLAEDFPSTSQQKPQTTTGTQQTKQKKLRSASIDEWKRLFGTLADRETTQDVQELLTKLQRGLLSEKQSSGVLQSILEPVLKKVGGEMKGDGRHLLISSKVYRWCGTSGPSVGDMQQNIIVSKEAGVYTVVEQHCMVPKQGESPQCHYEDRHHNQKIRSVAVAAKLIVSSLQVWDKKYRGLTRILKDLNGIQLQRVPENDRDSFTTEADINLRTHSVSFFLFPIHVKIQMRAANMKKLGKTSAVWITVSGSPGGVLDCVNHHIKPEVTWPVIFNRLKPMFAWRKLTEPDSLSASSVDPMSIYARKEQQWRTTEERADQFVLKRRTVGRPFSQSATSHYGVCPVEDIRCKVIRPSNSGHQRITDSRKTSDEELLQAERVLKGVLEERGMHKGTYLVEISEQGEVSVLTAIFYSQNLLKRYTLKIRRSADRTFLCKTEVSHRLSAVNSLWKSDSSTTWQDIPETDPSVVVPPIVDSVQEWLAEDTAPSLNMESRGDSSRSVPINQISKEEGGGQSRCGSLVETGPAATVLIKRECPLLNEDDAFGARKKIKAETGATEEEFGVDAARLMGL